MAPVIFEAAKRRSAICDGLSDGRLCQRGVLHAHERTSRIESGFTFLEDHLRMPYSNIVRSFPEIALVLHHDESEG